MSDSFSSKGVVLGHIHSDPIDSTRKFVIEFEGIGALETLCRLSDEEILEIGGLGEISYEDFKAKIFKSTYKLHLTSSDYIQERFGK
ncbi:MAG TPA: hypothetical protein VJJ21_04455 [Candidatus Nanoarchaeia archaeon]|nr:hypothetical protein [Candidatus Nanoarchaeia archaeon]